jgi:hypothetical protein
MRWQLQRWAPGPECASLSRNPAGWVAHLYTEAGCHLAGLSPGRVQGLQPGDQLGEGGALDWITGPAVLRGGGGVSEKGSDTTGVHCASWKGRWKLMTKVHECAPTAGALLAGRQCATWLHSPACLPACLTSMSLLQSGSQSSGTSGRRLP